MSFFIVLISIVLVSIARILMTMTFVRGFYAKLILAIPLAGLWLLALTILGPEQTALAAQPQINWSEPVRVPGFSDGVQSPYMATDSNRTVHVVMSDWVGETDLQLAVVYNRWTLENGWTEPVDVLLSPYGQARVKGLFLDKNGILHVVFFGGDETQSNIYYSRAYAAEADRATAWSEPALVGEHALLPDEATIVGDADGNLYILYSGNENSSGLYARYSNDGGHSWSEAISFYFTYDHELWPSALKAYVDDQGDVHAVWSVANITGNGVAVYYARLDSDSRTWTEPLMLAEAVDSEVDTPSIIQYEDELFVIYHDGFPSTTRRMRRSDDGGETWTDSVRLFDHVGSNGPASLAVDSNNTLHMFFGNRLDAPDGIIQGMWHSVWQGDRWSDPQAVISGPRGPDFDPSFARSVISQGDVILLLWETDPGAVEIGGIWYSVAVLDAPELEVRPLPAVIATPAATHTPSPTITARVEAPVQSASGAPLDSKATVAARPAALPQDTTRSGPAILLLNGVAPAASLVLIVLAVFLLRRKVFVH